MTLMLLWQEHTERHAGQNTHRYSQFCENYRNYAKRLKRSIAAGSPCRREAVH